MKPLTKEWFEKAEGDLATAERECRARKMPNYDAVCFHAQQCVEKHLKAFLQEHDTEFSKTHNLSMLLDKVVIIAPMLEILRPSLQTLNIYAVEYRYPGESADKDMAKKALKLCRNVRNALIELIVK